MWMTVGPGAIEVRFWHSPVRGDILEFHAWTLMVVP
jgi:hypothetical protein